MKKIILILCVLLSAFTTKAQVINVCGTDSVTLTVDNYVNGTIEWQESIDTLSWASIPEVSGITYRFLPTQTKYYRAVVKTTDCQPLYSAISFVQLPPVANAGIDRTIGTESMSLLANYIPGAIGEWTILSGNGGVLDNNSNPKALLTGVNNETYKLKWTLTNACGQSSDTVQISFNQLDAKTNFIVVDNTDSVFSDSTQIANGVYRIKFSDPNIYPVDSVVLIGMRQDISFLRKVDSFTLQDSIYTFVTEQGTFQDLFKSGVINIGDAVNQSMSSASTSSISKIKSAKTFPTRKTLEEYQNSKDIQILYVSPNKNAGLQKLKNATTGMDEAAFTLKIDDQVLLKNDSGTFTYSIKDAYIKVTPRFLLDFKYEFPATLTDLRIGVDNAEFEFNMATEMVCSKAASCSPSMSLDVVNYHLFFTIGVVPIDVLVKFNINATSDFNIGGSIKYEQTKNIKQNLTAIAEGDKQNNFHLNFSTPSPIITNTENFSTKAEINAEVKIGPKISFLLYGIAGPYLEVYAKSNASACVNSNLNWDVNGAVGFEGNLGANADIIIKKTWISPEMSLKLFHCEYPLFSNAFSKSIKLPYKLELLSGNFQSGTSGAALSQPISLKVVSDWGFGVPIVPVRFETGNGNGTVSKSVLFTDSNGEVTTNWTLGYNPQNKLKVSVLDCNDNDIENSPMYIYASSATQTYDCTNSSLSINMKSANGYMYPSVTGGTAPYTYSTNGIDYSSTKPQFKVLIPKKDTVFVKDKNQCIRSRTFEIKPLDACANTDLTFDVLIQPNILCITGKNGVPPYQYSVDDTNNFTSITTYYKLIAGTHTVYVKDNNGCMASHDVVIDNSTNTAAIRSSYPAQNATSVPINGITFQWVAADYVANQVYDLYLKKGTDAYTLIASNQSPTSFTYTTNLLVSTTYVWKVAVKNGNIVLDNNEFSFNTASGIATMPTVPVLLQPDNGGSVYSPALLKWTPQLGDFKYDLYLDTNDASTLVALNLTNAEYTVNNLISGKTYYWKVKIKSSITGSSAFSEIRNFSAQQNNNTFTDIDGNVYNTVTIGTQTWMAENLRTTKYNDGTSIPNVTDNTSWTNLSTPAYCWYNNDITTYKNTYGALYNWYTVNTAKLAPAGWHVPTDVEWKTLITYLGGESVAGGKLKEVGTLNWRSPNTDATNETGFSALPSGGRGGMGFGGKFGSVGYSLLCWSSTQVDTGYAWEWTMGNYNSSNVTRGYASETMGYSVRCVRDIIIPTLSSTTVTNISQIAAFSGGDITSDGGAISIIARGVCWSTIKNPTISDSHSVDGTGTGSFSSNLTGLVANTTYFVRAYATNSVGTSYGNELSFTTTAEQTITDIDGNIYHTIKIGTQTWMVENLKTTHYNDGTAIPNVTDNTAWTNLSTPAYCWYNNDATTYKNTYGALYNWYTVNTAKLALAGWHIPTNVEWTILENYLMVNSYNYDGTTSGNKYAKSLAATTNWTASTNAGTIGNDLSKNNSTGFSALPGGNRNIYGTYGDLGYYGYWWSATEGINGGAWIRSVGCSDSGVNWGSNNKTHGYSVRCVRD
jgi:uncharacterized protein (TIGR02145 family)